jgi:hypothetical protein
VGIRKAWLEDYVSTITTMRNLLKLMKSRDGYYLADRIFMGFT